MTGKTSLHFPSSILHSQHVYLQVESVSEWQRMYCVLKKLQLQCYDAEAEHFSKPEITIPITKVLYGSILVNNMSEFETRLITMFYLYLLQSQIVFFQETQICKTDPASCEKENTFLISVVKGRQRVQHSLSASNEHELKKWWNGLQQHMLDQGTFDIHINFSSCY